MTLHDYIVSYASQERQVPGIPLSLVTNSGLLCALSRSLSYLRVMGAILSFCASQSQKRQTAACLAQSSLQHPRVHISCSSNIITACRMRINSSLLVPLLVLVGVLTINLNCGRGVFVSAFSSPRRTLSPQQIEVLLEIAESWPNLKTLSTGAWTRANLEQSCLGSPAALGISCDGYGWVIELAFTSESITTGPLPAALANLTRLMVFATAGGVSGSLPASFSALTHLTTFELSKSNIEGPIPASWSSLSNMTNLRLQWAPSAAVVGWTDGVLEGWLNLNKVVLSNLNVGPSNPLPPELFSSDSIATLQLLNVTFDGSMPIISNSNSALHTLVISGSPAVVSISASPSTVITADWSDLSITEMTLTNLPWSGDFPTFLPPNITMISLTNLPNLAGTIPSDLFDYGVLRVVTMVDLPEVAGSMPAPSNASTSILTSITMSNMAVTGSIEGSFFASRYLQDLKMENMEDMTPSALPEAGIECGLSALVLYVFFVSSSF